MAEAAPFRVGHTDASRAVRTAAATNTILETCKMLDAVAPNVDGGAEARLAACPPNGPRRPAPVMGRASIGRLPPESGQ